MCNCPAHFELVDCVCQCDHGADRMSQWRRRTDAAEVRLAAVAKVCDEAGRLVGGMNLYVPVDLVRAALAATREHLAAMTRDAEDDGLYDAIDGTTA